MISDLTILDGLGPVKQEVLQTMKEEQLDEDGPNTEEGETLVLAKTPPGKRRRLCGRTGPMGGSPGDTGKQPPALAKDPACSGCGRVRGIGKCFREEGRLVEWAYPDGRGIWCQDCFTVWRTSYQNVHTQRSFEKWISDPANLATFLVTLFAYVSLLVEGATRITAALISERVALLQWVSRMLGVPLGPYCVTLLGGLPGHSTEVEAESLVQVATDSGMQWGVVTRGEPCLGAIAMQPFGRPFFGMWQNPPVLTAEDRDAVSHLMVASAVPPSGEAVAKPAGVLVAAATTKLGAAFGLLRSQGKKALQDFVGEGWPSMKEGAFTKLLVESSKLHAEAGTAGDEEVFRSTEAFSEGLSFVKKFIRTHRDHNKHKSPFGKLHDLAPVMVSVRRFLQNECQVQPSTTCVLLAMRAGFVQSYLAAKELASAKKLESAAQFFAESGLNDIFCKGGATLASSSSSDRASNNRLNPSLWLRVVFTEVLIDVLSVESTADAAATKARDIHRDLVAAQRLPGQAFPGETSKPFLRDVASFVIVLDAQRRGIHAERRPGGNEGCSVQRVWPFEPCLGESPRLAMGFAECREHPSVFESRRLGRREVDPGDVYPRRDPRSDYYD